MASLLDLCPSIHDATMPSLFSICFGINDGDRRNKPVKKVKDRPDSWFETCTVSQLKELCKASKLHVSGAKGDLCNRLTSHAVADGYGAASQKRLKAQCKEKLLIQGGNKFDQVLRLLYDEYGTGTAKRAATETIVDDVTGEEVQVIKKRAKTTLSPKMMYTRVEKKMKAITQKKYQSHYGSKTHSPDVYKLMMNVMEEHIIDGKIINNDPKLAVDMATAVFSAFNDNFKVMRRPGYESSTLREAIDLYAYVLKAAHSIISAEDIEEIVRLLESIDDSVDGYGLNERSSIDQAVFYTTGRGKDKDDGSWRPKLIGTGKLLYSGASFHAGENVIVQAIQVLMPDYDKKSPVVDKKRWALF